MQKINLNKILFCIFIFAFSLRISAVFNQKESDVLPVSDAKQYDNIAVNIISGNGFSQMADGPRIPTTDRTPGYPLFLAGIYAAFGHNYLAVKIIQAIIGALFCVIMFFISRNIYGDLTGITASLLTAVYMPFASGILYYGGPQYLLSEGLYMFFMGLSILGVVLFTKKENIKTAVLTGISIGITVLIKPEFILFPIIALVYLVSKWNVTIKLKKYTVIYIFIVLTMTPWVIRNYMVEKKFIPLSTYSGHMFWMGNNSLAKGGWAFPKEYKDVVIMTDGLSGYERNKVFFKKGMESLKENPKRLPMLFIKKILVHWVPFEEGLKIFNPYYAFILLFGAIGLVFYRNRSISEGVLIITLLVTAMTSVIIFGDPRYRYPYEFCLIIFASLVIAKIYTMFNTRKLT